MNPLNDDVTEILEEIKRLTHNNFYADQHFKELVDKYNARNKEQYMLCKINVRRPSIYYWDLIFFFNKLLIMKGYEIVRIRKTHECIDIVISKIGYSLPLSKKIHYLCAGYKMFP